MSKSHKKRSLIKTLTWRIIATSDTFLISWIITGAATLAGAIAGIEIVTKMFLYYLHERGWNKIKWAKQVSEGHTTLLPFYCYFSCFKQYYDAPEHSQIHKKEAKED